MSSNICEWTDPRDLEHLLENRWIDGQMDGLLKSSVATEAQLTTGHDFVINCSLNKIRKLRAPTERFSFCE